jgi:predicted RNase H-like HicB family nuclease
VANCLRARASKSRSLTRRRITTVNAVVSADRVPSTLHIEKCRPASRRRKTLDYGMPRKATVVIEKDEHGFYAWCPELKGCQSQGLTLEEVMANIKEAAELYLETFEVNA